MKELLHPRYRFNRDPITYIMYKKLRRKCVQSNKEELDVMEVVEALCFERDKLQIHISFVRQTEDFNSRMYEELPSAIVFWCIYGFGEVVQKNGSKRIHSLVKPCTSYNTINGRTPMKFKEENHYCLLTIYPNTTKVRIINPHLTCIPRMESARIGQTHRTNRSTETHTSDRFFIPTRKHGFPPRKG